MSCVLILRHSASLCADDLLPMPLNPSALSAPPPTTLLLISSPGPRCTPCLGKAASGWARCPDMGCWREVHSSRPLRSQCCPRCPDEPRCGENTARCQGAGSAGDHRLNSGSLPLQKLGWPDTGPDRLHHQSFETWKADHVAALSKIKRRKKN